jgi:hypothetical protein
MLSNVEASEGESSKLSENQIILDLPPKAAGDDKMRQNFWLVQ